jgi:hypothetical protein
MSGALDLFNEFKLITGSKKIVSFGGWSFSTDGDTFPIFRQGVTDAQRQAFANSVVSVRLLRAHLSEFLCPFRLVLVTGLTLRSLSPKTIWMAWTLIGSILAHLTFPAFPLEVRKMGQTI